MKFQWLTDKIRVIFSAVVVAAICLGMLYGLYSVMVGIFKGVTNSDWFLESFYHEKYVLKIQKRNEFRAKWRELNIRECRIWIQAKLDVIPIQLERNLMYGDNIKEAREFAYKGLDEENRRCNEHGIMPELSSDDSE